MGYDFFDNEARQVYPGEICAFGLMLLSEQGKASELAEMLNFAELAALSGANTLLKGLAYDKQGICTLHFRKGCTSHTSRRDGVNVTESIDAIAKKSLSHYRMGGVNVDTTEKNRDSPDIPAFITRFWTVFFHLDQRDAFGVNHYGKSRRDMMAINFPHLARVASRHRVALPPVDEVKRWLKQHGAKTKSVWSLVSKERNKGDGATGVRAPEVVRCWVFNRHG